MNLTNNIAPLNYQAWLVKEGVLVDVESINYHEHTLSYLIETALNNAPEKIIINLDAVSDQTVAKLRLVSPYTDSQDKRICTGDVLFYEPYETHGNNRVVQFNENGYSVKMIRSRVSTILSEAYDIDKDNKLVDATIIGNIYQNPEMLSMDYDG